MCVVRCRGRRDHRDSSPSQPEVTNQEYASVPNEYDSERSQLQKQCLVAMTKFQKFTTFPWKDSVSIYTDICKSENLPAYWRVVYFWKKRELSWGNAFLWERSGRKFGQRRSKNKNTKEKELDSNNDVWFKFLWFEHHKFCSENYFEITWSKLAQQRNKNPIETSLLQGGIFCCYLLHFSLQ